MKFDVKEAPGTDGASITYRGYTPAKVEITWALYTEDMLRDFESLLPDIRPKPGKTAPKPVEITTSASGLSSGSRSSTSDRRRGTASRS